tara:strand:- start:165 stop:635 length:471 start_codon:yes stop_codon:yes gene_type:complete
VQKNKWYFNGVKVISEDDLDDNTPQTKGMKRFAAITKSNVGAEKIWAGKVEIEPAAKTGAHHHGELESVIYVLSGKAKMRWGEKLEFEIYAYSGDFIFVPPYVPHQEINASKSEKLRCVLFRSGQDPVVVNLDIPEAEQHNNNLWIDDIHNKNKGS